MSKESQWSVEVLDDTIRSAQHTFSLFKGGNHIPSPRPIQASVAAVFAFEWSRQTSQVLILCTLTAPHSPDHFLSSNLHSHRGIISLFIIRKIHPFQYVLKLCFTKSLPILKLLCYIGMCSCSFFQINQVLFASCSCSLFALYIQCSPATPFYVHEGIKPGHHRRREESSQDFLSIPRTPDGDQAAVPGWRQHQVSEVQVL